MKKITLILATLLLSSVYTIKAQQVERDMVLLEIITGTWCQFCPGAAMGADDMIENGHDVAILEYHGGDSFENDDSRQRIRYYYPGSVSYPTAKFDGIITREGGSATQSLYTSYLQKYNQRKPVNSSFTIDVTGEMLGLTDYTATVTIEKVANFSGSNLKLQFALTQSHIMYTWQGQDHLNFVLRKMVPSYQGTAIDFSSGDIQTVDLEFSIDPSWVREDIEIVVFVQANSSKEVMQATKLDLTEFPPAFDYNAEIFGIKNIPQENCTEKVGPVVKIANISETPLTQLDFEYSVNDGNLASYQWTGNLDLLETEEVELPEIEFTLDEQNTVEVYCVNPNGQADEYPDNDSAEDSFIGAEKTAQTVKLYMTLDSKPEEISWEVLNADNEVLYSGGDYTQSGQTISETFDFDEIGCKTFIINDTGGDGLKSGFFLLYYNEDQIILQGTQFGEQAAIQFGAGGFVGTDEINTSPKFAVYPNPFNDKAVIDFTLTATQEINISIYNLTGEKVLNLDKKTYHSGNHQIQINAEEIGTGVFFIRFNLNDKTYTEIISITK